MRHLITFTLALALIGAALVQDRRIPTYLGPCEDQLMRVQRQLLELQMEGLIHERGAQFAGSANEYIWSAGNSCGR